MFIELLSDFPGIPGYTKGSIHELPDPIARGYVQAEQARESTALDHLRAGNRAEMDRFKGDILEAIHSLKDPTDRGKARPPAGGGGVDFSRIDGSDPIDPSRLKPAERRHHTGQLIRAVHAAQAIDTPAEKREWGRSLLDKLYAEQRVSYKVTDDGNLEETVRIGDTTITRTGTESISGGPSYGFLVKPEWSDVLFRVPIEESVIEPYGFQIPVGQAAEFKWPALNQYMSPVPGQSAAYAGFQLARKGEISKRQYTDGKTQEIDYKITDLTAFTTISRDLDADAYIRVDAMINQVLGQAYQWKKDYEFIWGNGVGQPQGFMNAGAALFVDRNTAGHIYYEDLVAMERQIYPAYWREAYWITNAAWTLGELQAIKNAAGTYVYQPNALVAQFQTPAIMGEGPAYNQLTFRAQGTLLGRPCFFSEKLAQLGQTGDLVLIAPRYAYGIATRAGLEMGLSEHFLFDTDQIAMRWKLRNDGKSLLPGPYIQSDGGATSNNAKVSWCSILAVHT